METCVMPALDRPAAELTVTDIYDIAALIGQEFERIIDRFGCECLVGVVPKVVRVLELLEALVSRGAAAQETEELRRELERLRQERSDRYEQERKHTKELELVDDVWRGEVQDLLSQITQLQAENKRLLVSVSHRESPVTEEDLQKQEGMSEKERRVMKKLEGMVDKQRDELRAKDHELTLRNEDIEAFQMQQHRLIMINQDLRRRIGVMEAQGKALIQQRAELEAAAQAQQQKAGALQLEVTRLKKELQDWELERALTEIEESSGMCSPATSSSQKVTSTSSSAKIVQQQTTVSHPVGRHINNNNISEKTPHDTIKANSVWMECGGDPGFLENCFERNKGPSIHPGPSNGENTEEEGEKDEDATTLLPRVPADTELEEETDSLEMESDKPRFTLQELRDVLQEKNELKAQVFVLQEELAYYKSESEDDTSPLDFSPSPPPCTNSTDQPESGIRRLIFTAIMPMVAAGLITDDPTLMPIRRLVSFV